MSDRKTDAGTEKVFLSMIVAAYNVEDYVDRCMQSIMAARCRNIEIILVMGKSSDRTNEICRSYADGKLVKCLQQNGNGLSNARNCGISASRGAYVTFIDADDCILPKAFACFYGFLFRMAQEREFDALVNDFYFVDADGKPLTQSRQIAVPKGMILDGSYTRRIVRSRGTFWNAWRYVYHREYLINKQRTFAEGRNCEDLDFAVRTMLERAKIIFCHMPYYGYCPIRSGSLTNACSWKTVRDFLVTERQLLQLCRLDAQKPALELDQRGNLAADLSEKLKELMVLTLPDIYEVPGQDREKTIQGYQKLFQICPLPGQLLLRILFLLCRKSSIKEISLILWKLKQIRRKVKYHADYKNALPCEFLRRRK